MGQSYKPNELSAFNINRDRLNELEEPDEVSFRRISAIPAARPCSLLVTLSRICWHDSTIHGGNAAAITHTQFYRPRHRSTTSAVEHLEPVHVPPGLPPVCVIPLGRVDDAEGGGSA